MLISDIVPYGRNARNNVKAIPKVAESIKEFGLRGTIGLESRENPVIVFGHTRVAACKSLGWTEIPDERIEFCDDLTPEQIKAFRIADNKTGDIATYNKSMLREEVRSLKDMDMSRFGLEFKSKGLPYGVERLRTDANPLVGAAVQLPLLLQGHSKAFDRCYLHRGRCSRQGRSKGLARRHARGDEALGAVPRAALRKEYRIRLRGLRGRRVQGRWISWAVGVQIHLVRGRRANGQEALAGRSRNH